MPFYLLFPFIYRRIGNIWHAVAAVLLMIFIGDVFRGIVTLFAADPQTYLLYATLNKLPIFGFGILAFHAVPLFQNHVKARAIGAICLFGALVVFMMIHTGNTALIYAWYWRGVMFCLTVLGFALNPFPLLVNPLTDWLGERSYSIYLMHVPVMITLWPTMRQIETQVPPAWSFLVILLMMATVTIVVSEFTYRFFERPINDYGRALARKLAGAPVTASKLKPAS
jgi:peptidoglycan/LPS O-acetylase OafA/YrhL